MWFGLGRTEHTEGPRSRTSGIPTVARNVWIPEAEEFQRSGRTSRNGNTAKDIETVQVRIRCCGPDTTYGNGGSMGSYGARSLPKSVFLKNCPLLKRNYKKKHIESFLKLMTKPPPPICLSAVSGVTYLYRSPILCNPFIEDNVINTINITIKYERPTQPIVGISCKLSLVSKQSLELRL